MIIMKSEMYYYGVVFDYILYSGFCTDTVDATNRNFADPFCNYDNWYRCGSDQCSMAAEFYFF